MIKKFVISFILSMAMLMSPVFAYAETTCVTQYGGAVVCGAATPEFHTPVKTGIADFNLPLIGFAFVTLSGVLYLKSKRAAL